MGGARSVPGHKHLTKAGALRLVPGLRRDALVGGIRYYDGQVDDARHTMTVARTAAAYGAVIRTSTQVVGFLKESDRVAGVRVRDVETGAETDVKARVVINSTGVWTDELQRLSGGRGRFRVRASKGVHLVVARDRITSESGIILKTEKSVLFVIPWKSHWIIGTTDTDWNLDLAHPAATKADIDYILDHVNKVLAVPLTHDDIEGVYAGLRPLLAGESEQSSKLSREHAVARVAPGLIAIAGGKYTTYRVMGADAVEAAAEDLPGRINPSCTEDVPLVGAVGYQALVNQADRLAAQHGVHPYRIRHLLDRYGSEIHELLAPGRRPIPSLLQPIPGRGRLPAGRGAVRGHPRGRAAPGGRAGPPDPDLHRVRAPRHRVDAAGRRDHGAGARLDRRAGRAGGRGLPGQGGRRAPVADRARRRLGREDAAGGAGGAGPDHLAGRLSPPAVASSEVDTHQLRRVNGRTSGIRR